jgi:hypothetical protein
VFCLKPIVFHLKPQTSPKIKCSYRKSPLPSENLRKNIQELRNFLSHTDWVYKPAGLFELITMFQGLLR